MVQNALQVVAPSDIYVVVGYRQQEVRDHLGPKFHYVEQEEPRGTGDAVRRVCEAIPEFDGNLLILYGDTPLFRPASILGLLNRHRLKQAHLTLLTAVVDKPLPYGRIIRDAGGQIIDIIEDTEASVEVRAIREINVGAYVVNAKVIANALQKLSPSPMDGDYRLTDCVHQLIRSGLKVESYQLYDQDEVQGINSDADLCASGVHFAEAVVSSEAAGGAEPHCVRYWRMAGADRRGLHAAQRAAACRRRWPTRLRGSRWRSAASSSDTIVGSCQSRRRRRRRRSSRATIFLPFCRLRMRRRR